MHDKYYRKLLAISSENNTIYRCCLEELPMYNIIQNFLHDMNKRWLVICFNGIP